MSEDELVEPEPQEILVRATVHLPDLPVGAEAYVDPRDPYMAQLLAGRLLVPADQ